MIRFLRSLFIFAFGSGVGLLVIFGILYVYLKSWGTLPYGIDGEVKIELKKGIALSELSKELESAQLIDSSDKYKFWIKLFSNFSEFKAGIYKVTSPLTPSELTQKFIEGSTYHEVKYEILIPEGFTLSSVIERFVNAGIGIREVFFSLARNRTFLNQLGISADSIEGYLYPATYFYYELPSEEQVFKDMVSTFWKKLPEGFELMAASRGINLYQAIIFGSLIEAETMYEDERPFISEVIWNRLENDMPLGIDAAIIYGISNFNGNLTKQNLLDSTNPYNLRIHRGLPPTPINSPTMSSLRAILNPTHEGYFYYVLSPGGQGRHYFSKTLAEHNTAVAKYLDGSR